MKIGFPRCGNRPTEFLSRFLSDLDLDVIAPPPVTERTMELGVRHSPEMMCFPYKVTLGSMIEVAELGAEKILQYSTGKNTHCRHKMYWRLQASKLTRLGYGCEIVPIFPTGLVKTFVRLSERSRWFVLGALARNLSEFRAGEQGESIGPTRPRIGIIGEIYCCAEEGVNRNLYELIGQFGGRVVQTVSIADSLSVGGIWQGYRWWKRSKYERAALRYFEGTMAGHAMMNVANLLRLIDEGIDGVVHVMPLTCMPECTIEDIVDSICEDNGVPLLRLPLDETNSPANVETRVETFVKLIARKGGNRERIKILL